MSDLNENVLDLIDKIDGNDNIEAENLFNNILQTKIDALLDAAKTEVASSMFNTQECADCDAEVNEALKGGQHKIDMNKNGKLDAHDFKLLRGRKTAKSERMDRALAKRVENNKKSMKEEAEQVDESLAGLAGLAIGAWRGAKGAQRAAKNTGNKGAGEYFKQFAKGAAGLPDERAKKKKMKEEVEQVDEASYSAKAAAAGKDIGKKGKMFSKIAAKASRKYGKERGAKIAGAVLAKLRKKGK